MDLQAARAIRAAQSRAWSQQLSEFPTWRPTPTRAEAQTKADNPANLVMLKAWDGSPINSRAFNPDEPPGGPETPRVAVAPSGIEVVSTLEVGNELRAIIGTFHNPTTALRVDAQRSRDHRRDRADLYAHRRRRRRHDRPYNHLPDASDRRPCMGGPCRPRARWLMSMDLQAARDRLAAQRQSWDRQFAEFPNPRPTPTRAEIQSIAAGGQLLTKEPDGSRVDPHALDPLDPSGPPPPPAEIPVVFGLPVCGHELHASPGKITPRRYFAWLRDGRPIPHATTLRYRLTPADIGCRILSPSRERGWSLRPPKSDPSGGRPAGLATPNPPQPIKDARSIRRPPLQIVRGGSGAAAGLGAAFGGLEGAEARHGAAGGWLRPPRPPLAAAGKLFESRPKSTTARLSGSERTSSRNRRSAGARTPAGGLATRAAGVRPWSGFQPSKP